MRPLRRPRRGRPLLHLLPRLRHPRLACAAGALTRAIDINRASAEAWWRRGYCRLQAGRAANALGDFDQAVRLNPALADYLRPLVDQARRAAGEEF